MTRLLEAEDYWSVWLHHSTVSCHRESPRESRLVWSRKTLYGNSPRGLLGSCRKICKVYKRMPPTVSPPAANLAFNFNSASTVPNNYLLWLFSFPRLQWFLHQIYPLAKEALWFSPKQNTKQRPLSQESWEAEVWAGELHLRGTRAVCRAAQEGRGSGTRHWDKEARLSWLMPPLNFVWILQSELPRFKYVLTEAHFKAKSQCCSHRPPFYLTFRQCSLPLMLWTEC